MRADARVRAVGALADACRMGRCDVAAQDLQDLAGNEPNAETLWLLVRVHRQLGNRLVEARYSTQLRRRFPLSPEAQELLKGNFE